MFNPHRGNSSGGRGNGKRFGDRGPWDRGSGGRDSGRPMMHDAVCSECGKDCQVPFRPTGNRPIFCSNCFKRDEDGGAPSYGGGRSERPMFEEKRMFKAVCDKCGVDCEVPFRPNGSKPIYCRPCMGKDGPAKSNGFENKGVDQNKEQLKAINAKLDAILKILTPAAPVETVKPAKVEAEIEAPKKVEKKKAAPKKKKAEKA